MTCLVSKKWTLILTSLSFEILPTPTSGCLQHFLCIFCFQQLNYTMSRHVYFFKLCLGISWILVYYLALILENSQPLSFQVYFPPFSFSSSGTLITHLVGELWPYVVSELFYPPFGFVYFFPICVWIWVISIDMSLSHWFFSSLWPIYWWTYWRNSSPPLLCFY